MTDGSTRDWRRPGLTSAEGVEDNGSGSGSEVHVRGCPNVGRGR